MELKLDNLSLSDLKALSSMILFRIDSLKAKLETMRGLHDFRTSNQLETLRAEICYWRDMLDAVDIETSDRLKSIGILPYAEYCYQEAKKEMGVDKNGNFDPNLFEKQWLEKNEEKQSTNNDAT